MKNIFSKASFIHKMLIVELFFSVSLSTFGQAEFIRAKSDGYCDTSIIRKCQGDSVLIYNFFDAEAEQSFFLLKTAGNNTPDVIYFDSLYIKDFEIFEKKVYFCGYSYIDEIEKAMFGFFYLYQFPNTNIYYYNLDDYSVLNKIDVYKTTELQFMEENHLVMTGSASGIRSDLLVDITIPVNAPLYARVHKSDSICESFDDVAVLNNYVVVSSRNKEYGIPVINYLQFKRPQLLGQNIFSMGFDKIRVSSPVANTIVLLEKSEGDKYASVYRNSGYLQMEMTLLEAPSTIHGGVTILGDKDNKMIRPMDIKYNINYKVYDILARNRHKHENEDYTFLTTMRIYHVTPDEINNVSIFGKGTEYPWNEVWSIDPYYSIFIASGCYQDSFRFYGYRHDQWDCPSYFEYQYFTGKPEGGYVGSFEIPRFGVRLIPNHRETKNEPFLFPIFCGEE